MDWRALRLSSSIFLAYDTEYQQFVILSAAKDLGAHDVRSFAQDDTGDQIRFSSSDEAYPSQIASLEADRANDRQHNTVEDGPDKEGRG